MTKVQKKFHVAEGFDDLVLARLADANVIYGIEKITVSPSRTDITVEFDASRLRDSQVESALQRAGVPIACVP